MRKTVPLCRRNSVPTLGALGFQRYRSPCIENVKVVGGNGREWNKEQHHGRKNVAEMKYKHSAQPVIRR